MERENVDKNKVLNNIVSADNREKARLLENDIFGGMKSWKGSYLTTSA